MDEPNGVYIGENIEVVITDKYTIAYRRDKQSDFLESYLLLTENYTCIGICRTTPATTEMTAKPDVWRYAFSYDDYSFSSDSDMVEYIGKRIFTHNMKGPVVFEFYDNVIYQAEKIENLNSLQAGKSKATNDNIAQCLQQWHLGAKPIIFSIDGKDTFIGVTINTLKHMYIFEMTESSIYSRAARYKTCNKGVVFNQNFRQGLNAYMLPDNRMASEDLLVNEN